MRAKRRAGRPKSERSKVDFGTKELQQKQRKNITDEALDVAFKKGHIDEDQHQAALRLRWLYCLKFGAPTVSAYDADNYKSGSTLQHMQDEAWRAKREAEYEKVVMLLHQHKAHQIIMWVAVFNKRPLCLRYSMRELVAHPEFYAKAERELTTLRDGLSELEAFFSSYQITEKRDSCQAE